MASDIDARPAVTFLASEQHRPSTTVPNYTDWWQSHMCVSGLPRAVLISEVGETRTRDLPIASPMFTRTVANRQLGDRQLGDKNNDF